MEAHRAGGAQGGSADEHWKATLAPGREKTFVAGRQARAKRTFRRIRHLGGEILSEKPWPASMSHESHWRVGASVGAECLRLASIDRYQATVTVQISCLGSTGRNALTQQNTSPLTTDQQTPRPCRWSEKRPPHKQCRRLGSIRHRSGLEPRSPRGLPGLVGRAYQDLVDVGWLTWGSPTSFFVS